ncbi:hypothetical protein TI05_12805, partial [Achromatium sp. WMS3]
MENPQSNKNSPKLINLIDNLLLEKLPLAGIRRVTGVSKSWLQNYVNQKYEEISKKVEVTEKPKGPLTIQCDEMWS